MNPGLNPAMSVELGHRVLTALMTKIDKVELLIRCADVGSPPPWIGPIDHYVLASDR